MVGKLCGRALTEEDLDRLVQRLAAAESFTFDTETTDIDPMRARLVGLAIALELARLHGGDLRLVPNVSGASFELSLPTESTT